jgi:23S rRNA pseudouridine2605 synthase
MKSTQVNDPAMTTRLQVYLAKRAVASRRACGEIVLSGRVTVDGQKIIEPGFRISSDMQVTLDGQPLPKIESAIRSIILNKPPGYICSRKLQSTSRNLGTVYDLIKDIPEHLNTVGRLDKDSEGLIVLSNDGSLNERLSHPRHGHSKTYRVTVAGHVSADCLEGLNQCRQLDDETIQPVAVSVERHDANVTVLKFVLLEGRNRQIRRMCRLHRLEIKKLVRTRIGAFEDRDLAQGHWRDLLPGDIERLTQHHV